MSCSLSFVSFPEIVALDKHFRDMESLNMIPPEPQPRYDPKCDSWSLGMVAACAALDLPRGPWPTLKVPQIARKLLSLCEYQGSVLDRIARECDRADRVGSMPAAVRDFIDACLQPDLEKRPCASALLKDKFPEDASEVNDNGNMFTFPTLRLRCNDLDGLSNGGEDDDDEEQPLDVLTIQETYYLWKLAGGDVLGELTRSAILKHHNVAHVQVVFLVEQRYKDGHANRVCDGIHEWCVDALRTGVLHDGAQCGSVWCG